MKQRTEEKMEEGENKCTTKLSVNVKSDFAK